MNNTINSIVACISLLLVVSITSLTPASAYSLEAYYLPISKHSKGVCVASHCPDSGTYNEVNNVTGIQSDKYTAFIMKNSYGKTSVFVGLLRSYKVNTNIKVFSAVGLITGYGEVMSNYKGVSVASYIGVDLHKKDDNFGLVMTLQPASNPVVSVGFRWGI